MDSVEYLVVGAGVSGLSFANWIRAERPSAEVLVLESDSEPGGYCKTIKQDGFVWDYSGHFFHFRRPEIEKWLRERMVGQDIRTVAKRTLIRFRGLDIDFPFQKNIHQLDREDFIACLYDLHFREQQFGKEPAHSFQQMLYQRLGKSISEFFLIPYNEKLYACSLDSLDVEAMGRFFPHANVDDIIRNMRHADNSSYNDTFTYPVGGAIEYIYALLKDLPKSVVTYGEALVSIDIESRVATTSKRKIQFNHLVSSAPFNHMAAMSGYSHPADAFTWNKVLVFNLGFDAKGPENVHWMYIPDRERIYYRLGWYDNIMNTPRMSLYVEIGAKRDATFDIDAARERVLEDLKRDGIVTTQKLVSSHNVVLDPAYVHITKRSLHEHARISAHMREHGVHAVGRYGGWTYCSIEDNMIETQELARSLAKGNPK